MPLPAPARRILVGLVLLALAGACGPSGETTAAETAAAEATGSQAGNAGSEQATGEAPAASPPPSETDATADAEGPLTVYSGRNEELIGPLIEQYRTDTGAEVEVRYGDTAELAALLLEEGEASPADVYLAQDAGALGAVAQEGLLGPLDAEVVEVVDERFRSPEDEWVGVSGRARVIAYNTEAVASDEVPTSVLDLTDEAYRGRVGWAPSNGSFQAFVTAMRVELGDDGARQWLEGMLTNDVVQFENNVAIVEAVGRGEIDFGLVNHYYLYRFLAEDPAFPVANSLPADGDVGALVNVAGVGVLGSTDQPTEAADLVQYLLGPDAQSYFATQTSEYPLVGDAGSPEGLPPLDEVQTPPLDLADLADLEGTLTLLREVGALT